MLLQLLLLAGTLMIVFIGWYVAILFLNLLFGALILAWSGLKKMFHSSRS